MRSQGTTNIWQLLRFQFWKRKREYELPTYLVSYPRSGSNFLQNVLGASSGFRCVPIYSSPNNPKMCLSLKTHAQSFSRLLGEIGRFTSSIQSFPSKLIILWRDPRDTFISYYEYEQSRVGKKLNQNDFLRSGSYQNLVAGFSPECRLQAFKSFVINWYLKEKVTRTGLQSNHLNVKFESLILKPQVEFPRIFDFLELDCDLAENALKKRVALGSSVRTQRGIVGGWKNYHDSFAELLDVVNSELAEEIKLLGYES